VSLVEIRCLCLHNQSLRERRMARVCEVRDCAGFAWSQFFASPSVLRKIPALLQAALVYPEIVGFEVCFNMAPGITIARAAMNMLPQTIRDKVIFSERGSWTDCVCTQRGLSPASLYRWSMHLQEFRSQPSAQHLTARHPQAVRALQLSADEVITWNMRCERWSSASVLHVSVHFFRETCCPPTHVNCCAVQELSARSAQSVWSGTFQAPSNGVILLEVELRTWGTVDIQASLARQSYASPEATPSSLEIVNSPIIDNTSSWSCWWNSSSFLVLVLSLFVLVCFIQLFFVCGIFTVFSEQRRCGVTSAMTGTSCHHDGLSGNATNN